MIQIIIFCIVRAHLYAEIHLCSIAIHVKIVCGVILVEVRLRVPVCSCVASMVSTVCCLSSSSRRVVVLSSDGESIA